MTGLPLLLVLPFGRVLVWLLGPEGPAVGSSLDATGLAVVVELDFKLESGLEAERGDGD